MSHDFLGKSKEELLELLDEARAAGDKIRGRLIHDHLVTSHGWTAAASDVPSPGTVTEYVVDEAEAVEEPAVEAEPEVEPEAVEEPVDKKAK